MTFTVIWKLTAIQQLNQILAAATEPKRVEGSAAFVDYMLRRVPGSMGESRGGNARLWYEDVLGVYYTVDTGTMTVTVMLVGPARRR